MDGMIKKYLPFATAIFAVFLLVPLVFSSEAMSNYTPVVWYFIFPGATILCSAIYCSKFGLDFLFALIAPIAYIPTMLFYYGGFQLVNIILLAVYLVAGIFGLFLGDIAFGDKRKKREEAEKAEAEELMLQMKRRDDYVKEQMAKSDDDDFDYEKYLSDADSLNSDVDDEVEQILKEFR